METEDAALIRDCLRGKARAQEQLYHKYAQRMYGVCLRYAADAEEARDIHQEGFIRMFRDLARFRGEGVFEGWLRRIFVHTALEFCRKRRRSPEFAPLDSTLESQSVRGNTDGAADALNRLTVEEILAMAAELPEGCRLVFNMYVVEGFTHPEIAEALEIDAGTSKSQLARARRLLKKKLSPTHETESLIA